MSRTTPCEQWDLRALLAHLSGSMADLAAALRTGRLDLAARGGHGPIPAPLATRLLRLCPLLMAGREGLFAAAVEVPRQASPGDRLVGLLGRSPEQPPPARALVTDE
jgi:hypothetical protein